MEKPNEPAATGSTPAKRGFPSVLIGGVVLLGAVLAVAIFYAPQFLAREETPPAYPRLHIGGTSTVFVIAENGWKTSYRDAKGVQLAYESTGTTAGVKRLVDRTYAVVFTHGPLSAEQLKLAREKGGEVVQVPVLLCGVAPIYNVKELKGSKTPLRLTGPLLAEIFLGKITQWNDPALRAVNPDLKLPPTKITVVHREESSGTTLIFTEYLDAVSEAWRAKVGPPASEIAWPVGIATKRNLGVAQLVYETEGAIGYVDRMFTTYDVMEIDYAAMETKDKSGFVRAEPENMTAAAAAVAAEIHDDLTFNLANTAGKDAYPISGVIYAACYQKQAEPDRKRVADFLHWVVHEGQPHARNMSYAALPEALVARIDRKLDTIAAP